jgi:hypothetical protein
MVGAAPLLQRALLLLVAAPRLQLQLRPLAGPPPLRLLQQQLVSSGLAACSLTFPCCDQLQLHCAAAAI